jgi:hypothetical protein
MTDLFNDDDFDIPDTAVGEDFDLDSLRASSARAGSTFDDSMEEMDDMDMDLVSDTGSASAFSLARFTPGQRLVLALLLLFDIVAIAVGILVLTGRI